MKHLKYFESVNNIHLYEYVIVKPNNRRSLSDEWKEWFKCHVGVVSEIESNKFNKIYYVDFETLYGGIETIIF